MKKFFVKIIFLLLSLWINNDLISTVDKKEVISQKMYESMRDEKVLDKYLRIKIQQGFRIVVEGCKKSTEEVSNRIKELKAGVVEGKVEERVVIREVIPSDIQTLLKKLHVSTGIKALEKVDGFNELFKIMGVRNAREGIEALKIMATVVPEEVAKEKYAAVMTVLKHIVDSTNLEVEFKKNGAPENAGDKVVESILKLQNMYYDLFEILKLTEIYNTSLKDFLQKAIQGKEKHKWELVPNVLPKNLFEDEKAKERLLKEIRELYGIPQAATS